MNIKYSIQCKQSRANGKQYRADCEQSRAVAALSNIVHTMHRISGKPYRREGKACVGISSDWQSLIPAQQIQH